MSRTLHLLFCLLVVYPPLAIAQASSPPAASVEVRATVIDASTGTVLPGASVYLRSEHDSSAVGGAVTERDGTFRIRGVPNGVYRLRISHFGYLPQEQLLTLASQPLDLGQISLRPSDVAIAGITVQAERAAVQVEVDRTIYSARDLVHGGGTFATDALRAIPGLDVDLDGNVSLNGSTGVVVQINGRATLLRGRSLANFLKQLSSSALEKIEVVTAPSAKYDPAGLGGIINLVLKRESDIGLSGGTNLSAGSGEQLAGGTQLGYQHGVLSLWSNYAFSITGRRDAGWNRRELLLIPDAPLFYQTLENQQRAYSGVLSFLGDITVGPKGVLSATAMLSNLAERQKGGTEYFENGVSPVESPSERRHKGRTSEALVGAGLGYRHRFTPDAHELYVEIRSNMIDHSDRSSFIGFGADDSTAIWGENAQRNLQLDYKRTGPLGIVVETGGMYTTREISSEMQAEGGSGSLYQERISAAYMSFRRNLGKIGLQGGLRGEHTVTELIARGQANNEPREYINLFPSISALYRAKNRSTLRVSYSRRIERPNAAMIEPFTSNPDPFNRVVGNPTLIPETSHEVSGSYQRFVPVGVIQIAPFYRHTYNVIQRIKEIDSNGSATTSYRNLAASDVFGTNSSASVRYGNLQGILGASVLQTLIRGGINGSRSTTGGISWSARASLTYALSTGRSLQYFHMYRSSTPLEQGRISSFQSASAAIQQTFMGGRAAVSLRLNDPFNAWRYNFTTEDLAHRQESFRKSGARVLWLNMNYNFGAKPKVEGRATTPPERQKEIGIQ